MNANINVSDVHLSTERLHIRPFCAEDLQSFYHYFSEDVAEPTGQRAPKSLEEAQILLEQMIREKKELALVLEGEAIGSIGIGKYRENEIPEFSDLSCRQVYYALSKEHWGKQLMPEALQAVLQYLFEEAGLDAVACGQFEENTRSAHVQMRCGFTFLRRISYVTGYGETKSACLNVLYREDWLLRGGKGRRRRYL